MRLAQRLRQAAMPSLPARWGRLSRRLLARTGLPHGRKRFALQRLAPLERVMRRCASSVQHRSVIAPHVSVSAMLRTAFTLHAGRATLQLAAGPRPPREVARSTLVRERLTLLQRERLIPSSAAGPIAERAARQASLLRQVVRVETHALARSAGGERGRDAGGHSFAPLPQPMLHTQAPLPDPEPRPRTADAAAGETAATRQRRGATPSPYAPIPLALPPHELSRVTEHVIRQLDRRVLSYIERTGRA